MVEVFWTQEAEKWLKNIHDYIADDNEKMAKKVVGDIYQKAQLLRSFSEIGYLYSNHENKQIRILLYGHYRIAYLLKTKQQIDVLGVFHGALAIEKFI